MIFVTFAWTTFDLTWNKILFEDNKKNSCRQALATQMYYRDRLQTTKKLDVAFHIFTQWKTKLSGSCVWSSMQKWNNNKWWKNNKNGIEAIWN